MSTTWRTSPKTYTRKPDTNCTAARAAWNMIDRLTGKKITSLRLHNGMWKASFSDGMSGEFNHTQGLTRTAIKQTRAAERLRAAVAMEEAERQESLPATNGGDTGAVLESVH